MANQTFISPGVFTREFDFSYIPTGVSQIGASLVGVLPKGPAFQPIKVTSFDEFRSLFLEKTMDEKYYLPYAVKEYLKNAGVVTITRVLGENSSTDIGRPFYLQFPLAGTSAASATQNSVLGIIRARNSNVTNVFLSGTPSSFTLQVTSGGSNSVVTNLSLDYTSNRYIKNVLGTDPLTAYSGDLLPGVYVDAVFDYYFSSVAGTASWATVSSGTGNTVAGSYQNARSTTIVSQNFNGTVYPLFTIYSRSDGNASTDDVKISITNVQFSSTEDIEFPKFNILVRDFYDTDQNPIVYESYQVSLDPSSPIYIANIIGDKSPTIDNTGAIPVIMYDGDYDNVSKYIYVKVNSGYPTISRPSGFQKYPGNGLGVIPAMPFKTTHVNEITSQRDTRITMGVDFYENTASIYDRIKYGTSLVSGNANSNNKGFIIQALSGELTGTSSLTSDYDFVDVTSSSTSVTASQSFNTVQFSFPLYGGWDSLDPRQDIRYMQNNGILLDEYTKVINILSNQDEYDFNLFSMPGVHSGSSGNLIGLAIGMVENRGDAMVIYDLGVDTSDLSTGLNLTPTQAVTQAERFDSSYAACYYPWVKIQDPDSGTGKRIWVPPSVVVLGAFSFSDRVTQPYYAVGGFNRGALPSVTEIRRKLDVSTRDTLYNSNVNPIASFPNEGIVILGQKTAQQRASSLDRVNVRRLLITMKKIVASTGRLFLFEANNQKVRDQIVNLLTPEFNKIKLDNGLEDFRIVMDSTVNTADIVDRNMMVGKIFLKPTKVAEIIVFDFNLTSSGATFNEP